jgi:putative Mn2+ efflux pump MntP
MEIFTTFVIAVGLAMDVFAVSLGIGTAQKSVAFRPMFRVSFHCGLFQGLMTLAGWLAGSTIASLIAGIDHWVAMGLLAFVGVRMIRSGFDPKSETQVEDPSRGRTLVMVCIATSIDAMAVGLSLAMLNVNILISSLVIGLVSTGMSVIGILAGSGLGLRFGKRMEVLGGLLLNGIGIRILLSHLL